MKKMWKAFVLSVAMVGVLAASAGAANFTHCADKLNAIGLFQGTSNGYDLDRAPTRAEAATMLVRLLGKEAEAQKLSYTAPFTDLQGWEKPYVQYLYNNKLTSGVTDTSFAPKKACTADMYTTFLLRALGYQDTSGDFSYSNAVSFAKKIGVADEVNTIGNTFLRDNAVAMSYTALNTKLKGSNDTTLLSKLITGGAVDNTKATSIRQEFGYYDDYKKATDAFNQEVRVDVDTTIDATYRKSGSTVMTIYQPSNMILNLNTANNNESIFAVTGSNKVMVTAALGAQKDVSDTMAYYYDRGNFYVNTAIGGKTTKGKQTETFQNAMDQAGEVLRFSTQPISAMESISRAGSTYTINFKASVMGSLSSVATDLTKTQLSNVSNGVSFNYVTGKFVVTNNKLSELGLVFNANITANSQALEMAMSRTYKVNGVGNSVNLTLPTDLSSYPAM